LTIKPAGARSHKWIFRVEFRKYVLLEQGLERCLKVDAFPHAFMQVAEGVEYCFLNTEVGVGLI
jgi:hypothetical protein